MKNIHRKSDAIAAITMVVVPLLITIYLLFLSPNDVSASQTGNQRIFGATYMTMNNPYFQVLDAQIQAHLELHGDVLLTRDAAMDQERQNQEIQELVDAGVCAIFMTPVEWDTSKEGVRIAADAGVPVIVVDAPIQDAELAACSVLSDNYQAGVLSPNDGIARAIITSCEQAGQAIPAISGLDAENESVEWVWAGRQCSTVAKPTDALVAQTIEIIKSLQAGNGMPATDVVVNNGKIDVLVYKLPPVVVTKDNAKEVFANDPGRLELLK